ncbi:MAG TPA: polymer-forming cytoskeletal protein, partial [Bryobacteraceae bacterium]
PVSDTDAVGSLIEGRVVGNVLSRGKVVIPDGATVHGRIRRLEHYQGNGNEFIVGLEFTELEGSGGPVRFYADLLSVQRSPQIRIKLTETVMAGAENVTLHELPGVASFFVSGKTFRLPEGFGTVWRTRGPIRGLE